MDSKEKAALTSNIQCLMTSLATLAIEEEFSYAEFEEVARLSFVKAAEAVLAGEKRVTDSRVSIITGIHRKDVKRLREVEENAFFPTKSSGNRAIAVISAWTREEDYVDSTGSPIPLAYDDEAPSLTTLIKSYSGDMPVRAVCDELERMGVIESRDDRWHLKVPVYVPNKSKEAMFNFLGEDTSSLIETIHHNINNKPKARRFQRSVRYDELSEESTALFKEFSASRSMDLLKEFDLWLSRREKLDKNTREQNPDLTRKKAGIGIYYFEETLAQQSDGVQS